MSRLLYTYCFLFPSFSSIEKDFRENFHPENLEYIETVEHGKETRYRIHKHLYGHCLKSLRSFSAVKTNFEKLKLSIFDEEIINLIYPGLEIIDNNNENLEQISLLEEEPNDEDIYEGQIPIPNEVLLFFVFAVAMKRGEETKLTQKKIELSLRKMFKIKKESTKFIQYALKSEVYIQLPDNKYEVDPLSKNFCVAALMKFIIDNLDELLLVIKDPKDIEIILTRMSEGSEKLRHDFWTQTVEFSKKKCQHWSPPISEKLILSFAILNTADINDCASKSAILDFIYANFPWYQLTKENFGLMMQDKKFLEDSPASSYTLSNAETILVKQQLRVLVTSNMELLKTIMPRMELFNIVLGAHQQIPPDSYVYSRPPFPESVMVIIALLHNSDKFGWSSAINIQKFVEVNFPYYQLEMATNFMQTISNWKEETEDGRFFNIEKESAGMMTTFQIKPEKFCESYAWVSKFLNFEGNEIDSEFKLYMKSPLLIKDILSLPPPSWSNFYSSKHKELKEPERNPESNQVSKTPSIHLTISKNIFHNSSSIHQEQQQPIETRQNVEDNTEHLWEKPEIETHIKITLALIVWDIKKFHDQNPVNDDVLLTSDSLHQRHSLSDIVKIVRDVFPYYEPKEQTKEFVLGDIQQNKKLIGEYFNLIKNEDGKLEYELKSDVLSALYEEIVNLYDWSRLETFSNFLKYSETVSMVFKTKSKLSENSLLSLILFLYGIPSQDYSTSLSTIMELLVVDFEMTFLGFSGNKWYGDQLNSSIRSILYSLIEKGEDYLKSEVDGQEYIRLRTEEGRIFEIFASLQKSCYAVSSNPTLSSSLHKHIAKFMEIPSVSSSPSDQPILTLETETAQQHAPEQNEPLEPPMPRNYLIGLALKNLASTPGSPVLMSQVWSYLSKTFPFFRHREPWCMAELEVGIGFNQDTNFSFQVVGDDFSIFISPQDSQALFQEVAEFSKNNVTEIQKCMTSS